MRNVKWMNGEVNQEDIITVSDFVEKFNVAKSRIYKAINEGDIPAEKKKVLGVPRKSFVIDKEFVENHTKDEIREILKGDGVDRDNVVTINDLAEDIEGINRDKIYKAVKDGRIPAEKKKIVGSHIKSYVIDKGFLEENSEDDIIKIVNYSNVDFDIEDMTTADDLVEKIDFCKDKIYRSLRNGVIPASKKSIPGKQGNQWVIDKDFMENHSYDEIYKMMSKRKSNFDKSELFSSREVADLFNKEHSIIRRLFAVLRRKDKYDIEEDEGLLYMKVSDVENISEGDINKMIDNLLNKKDYDNDWEEIIDIWNDIYNGGKIRAGDIYNIVEDNDLLDRNEYAAETSRGELINFGRLLKKKVGTVFNGFEINIVEQDGTANYYYLDKKRTNKKKEEVNKDVGSMYYIYEIYASNGKKDLENRMFTYTACDGEWEPVNKELDKIKYFMSNIEDYDDRDICDYAGRKMDVDDFEEDFWYFTIIPNGEFENKFLFSIHNTDGYGNFYQYYVSPIELEWLEDADNLVSKNKVSELEYAIYKFKEENPELADNMDIISNMIKGIE